MGCGTNNTAIGQGPAGTNCNTSAFKFIKSAYDLYALDITTPYIVTSVSGDDMRSIITEAGNYIVLFNCYLKNANTTHEATVQLSVYKNTTLLSTSPRIETIQIGTAFITYRTMNLVTEKIVCNVNDIITIRAQASGTGIILGNVNMYTRVMYLIKVQ